MQHDVFMYMKMPSALQCFGFRKTQCEYVYTCSAAHAADMYMHAIERIDWPNMYM